MSDRHIDHLSHHPSGDRREVTTDLMLHHGGRLHEVANRYGIPVADWLDLSTGINPNGWPVPAVPPNLWSRLPQDDDELEQCAQDYYAAEQVLPVAGSQAAILALPRLRPACRVAVLDPGYAEHAHAWRREGHTVSAVTAEQVDDAVRNADVLVLIHPNNPTGERFSVQQLLAWHQRLAAHGGWLLVDEAFMDITPEHSLCPYSTREGLIVLRSLGKFFGLAGARVGFVCGNPALLGRLRALLGPWTVSGPARWIAAAALQDAHWQATARRHLKAAGTTLNALLSRHGLFPAGDCALFQWVRMHSAAELHATLARQGILTRLFSAPGSLRFGLPGNDQDWGRLDNALHAALSSPSAGVLP